jgi:hypothetical protein
MDLEILARSNTRIAFKPVPAESNVHAKSHPLQSLGQGPQSSLKITDSSL